MIRMEGIQIKYGDFIAVDNLNLNIEEGDFFTLLGPSGCGKTTTLRALVGFNKVSEGKIFVKGKDITNESIEKRGIGIVFQSYALFPTMTVYENIEFGLKVMKLDKMEIDKRVREVANKVHIDDSKLNNNVSELSGGQQQRVAIARALVLNPSILCLDEPLSNLDAKLRVELRGELKRLQRELKITFIYVTHDQEEALTVSSKIAVFNEGKIEQIGTPKEIYEQSKSPFVCEFIGDINKIKTKDVSKISNDINPNFDMYFRLEKLSSEKINNDDIEIEAEIKDVEYTGMVSKVTYKANGLIIRNIEKNSKTNHLFVGNKVKLYLAKDNVIQFGE